MIRTTLFAAAFALAAGVATARFGADHTSVLAQREHRGHGAPREAAEPPARGPSARQMTGCTGT